MEFLGGSDDVRPFIADSDCIVRPTFYPEGTPRAVLEAAAIAKPIIASNVPGCREVVIARVNGYVVPPRGPHALAERMLRLLALPKDELAAFGAASRARAERQFDERLVISEYLSAIATGDRASSIR